jgi:hypothetical protein
MIAVRQPLRIEESELTFWMGDAFDYTTPFREALQQIADRLSASAPCILSLPPREDPEDFIQGTLEWDGLRFGVYFEHSLGYLSLMSDSVSLKRLLWEISGIVTVERDQRSLLSTFGKFAVELFFRRRPPSG